MHHNAMISRATRRLLNTQRQPIRTFATQSMTGAVAEVSRVPAESLHVSKPTWWLESRFHFSFADWFDPTRQGWGVLRVVNDDLVKGRAGFGAHPHRDMEIFSYVVDGELSHADSMGQRETLGRGAVQYMSAGTGVRHSEMNEGDATCRFLQIWIVPDRRGHTPQYGSSTYEKSDRHNKLLHILGGTRDPPQWAGVNSPNTIRLHQDANVYVSETDPGHTAEITLASNRQIYAVCIEGSLNVNGVDLQTRDAAMVVSSSAGPSSLTLKSGDQGAHYLFIEMAQA